MASALALAEEAGRQGEVPVGAVVVCNGSIVGRGYNQREQHHDPTAHAEVLALRQASQTLSRWRLGDCTVYVTLEPCPMCTAALVSARVGTVVYGAPDPAYGACGSLLNLADYPGMGYTLKVRGGCQAERSRHLLASFFASRRP